MSEPSEIARLFADCDDEHDHEAAHEKRTLGEVARLDTCVTVVDSHDFLQHLELDPRHKLSVANSGSTLNTAQLLVEQVEYSNVVVLNKTDLVSPSQLDMIEKRVLTLNPKAKLLTSSKRSPVANVMEVVDTKVFHPDDFDWERDLSLAKEQWATPALECCAAKQAAGESPCCGSSAATSDATSRATKSQSFLRNTVSEPAKKKARHEARFDMKSFLYTSRYPLHPERFREQFVNKYFVVPEEEGGDDGEDEETDGRETEEENDDADEEEEDQENLKGVDEKTKTLAEKEIKQLQEELEERIEEMQVDAAAKQAIRREEWGGQLVRSKGFLWLGNMHDLKMAYSQAGSMVTIEDNKSNALWNVLNKNAYVKEDTKEKKRLRENWVAPYGDRRQELVFIGVGLQPKKIQHTLGAEGRSYCT